MTSLTNVRNVAKGRKVEEERKDARIRTRFVGGLKKRSLCFGEEDSGRGQVEANTRRKKDDDGDEDQGPR